MRPPHPAQLVTASPGGVRSGVRSESPRPARNERGCLLRDVLAPWQDKYPDVGVIARASVGHAATELIRMGSGADLIVVGRRIRRSSVGAHIGPVAHAVLHHAKAPVAVIAHE
ncbi:hypothetical protein GCM10020254_06170 [Streptomyces goshikiensis]